MVIVLHDEVGAEETANPAAKYLNDSHSCHDEVHPVWTHEKLSLPFKVPFCEVKIVTNV